MGSCDLCPSEAQLHDTRIPAGDKGERSIHVLACESCIEDIPQIKLKDDEWDKDPDEWWENEGRERYEKHGKED